MSSSGPWLSVDLAALVRNARQYAGRVGIPLLPMVKANGYGLGAVAVARALEPLGPWGFGVASPAEAAELRAAGINQPLIAFQPLTPDRCDEYLAVGVRPVIGSLAALEAWTGRSAAPFHVEIDTGMGRSGFRWHEVGLISRLRELVARAGGFEGIFTHFTSADTSATSVVEEWERLQTVVESLTARPALIHGPNSAAGQWAPFRGATLARPGIFLYGGRAGAWVPEPVAGLLAPVIATRTIRAGDPVSYGGTWRADRIAEIATLAIGYADGVHRVLGNRGEVSIRARRYPIVGRVTMDMTLVAAAPGEVRVGDIATLFGADPLLDEAAEWAGTISYELLTAVGQRVTRRYGGV